jgi:UDP-glucose 4-epimerase
LKVYITGVTGYLGSNVLKKLIENKHIDEIRLLIRDEKRKQSLFETISNSIDKALQGKISYQLGSLPDSDLNLSGIDCLVHSAAVRDAANTEKDFKKMIDVNIFGTKQIMADIKKYECQRTIFISSQSIYLKNPSLPWGEDIEPAPAGVYSATKYAGELITRELHQSGLQYSILRPSHLYGKGLNRKKNELETVFARGVAKGEPLLIHGDGKRQLDFCHIRDICTIIETLILSTDDVQWNQVYNVGQGNPVSINEIARIYQEKAKSMNIHPVEINYIKGHQKDLYPVLWLDISKAKRLLKWEPKVTIKQGLEEILEEELELLQLEGEK